MFTLYSLAKDFSSALDISETLSLFSKKIEDFVPFDTCLRYLMEPGGGVCDRGAHGRPSAASCSRIDVSNSAKERPDTR